MSIRDKIIEKAKEVLGKKLQEAFDLINQKTPEDTFELIKSTRIVPGVLSGDRIVGRIENTDPKAKIVEYGVLGRKYNYYKNSGRRKGGSPFYSGNGARMFSRTRTELLNKK